MRWMFDIHFESGLISRRGPCLSAPHSREAVRASERARERAREREEKKTNQSGGSFTVNLVIAGLGAVPT